jgi:hypothetical protein
MDVDEMADPIYKGHWAEIILHSDMDGTFKELWIAPELEASVAQRDLWVKAGDKVERFSGANKAIGSLVMNWPSEAERDARMQNPAAWLRILTEESENA